MRRAHPTAVRIEQNPGQQVWLIAGRSFGSIDAVLGEDCLHIVPQCLVDDGFMLAWIALALVDDFTPINSVLQHQVERTAGDWLAAMPAASEAVRTLLTMPAASRSSFNSRTDLSSV